MLVEVHRLAQRQRLLEPGAEHVGLASTRTLACLHPLLDDTQNCGRVDAFVDMQADRVHLETGALSLASPVEVGLSLAFQLLQRGAHGVLIAAGQCVINQGFDLRPAHVELQGWVDVRVVGPGGLRLVRIVVGRDHAHVGVVRALLVVLVGDDRCAVRSLLRLDLGLGLARFRQRHVGLRGLGCVGAGRDFLAGECQRRGIVQNAPDRAAAALALGQFASRNQRIPSLDVIVFGDRGVQSFGNPFTQAHVADGAAVLGHILENCLADIGNCGLGHLVSPAS